MLVGEGYSNAEIITHEIFQILKEHQEFRDWYNEFTQTCKYEENPYIRIEEKVKEVLKSIE